MATREDLIGAEVLGEYPLEADEPEDVTGHQALVQRMLEEAVQWREENLEPAQRQATEYYKGEPFGNEEDGRSKVVMTEVRDVVMAKMPSLMRIFFGPERVVEYRPRGPEDVASAEQATDYVNYVVAEDNPGFLVMHSAFQDAEIRKLGIIKWWWEDRTRVEESEHTGLSEAQVALLAAEPGVDVQVTALEPETATYDVRVTRIHHDGRARIAAVPPEEFVFSPHARSLDEARMVAHVREIPADELIADGVPEDVVERAKGKTKEGVESDSLEAARRIDGSTHPDEDEQDESTRPVRFAEIYARVDADGDGVSELRKFRCVGPDCEIVNGDGMGEVVDERPFALFCPNPEAHTMVGMSDADLVLDLQLIKSSVVRGMLDSLSMSLNPGLAFDINKIRNVGDLTNNEVGRLVRTTGRPHDAVMEMTTPFVGADALPVIAYIDETRESRTGTTKASAGLDADVLQSTTRAAVEMTRDASRQHVELTARIFAETGMKQLFRGLLKLITRHQNAPRMVRLRNEFVPIDPKHWDASMDVQVNVALGGGTTESKLESLAVIMEKQEMMLEKGVPLTSFSHYRNTLRRALELLGWKNSDEFFAPWTAEQDQQMQQAQAQQPPQPSESEVYAQIEQLKVQARQQEEAAKLQLEQWKAQMEDDRERDRTAREMALKEYDIELKYQAKIEDAALKAKVQQNRDELDARQNEANQATDEAA